MPNVRGFEALLAVAVARSTLADDVGREWLRRVTYHTRTVSCCFVTASTQAKRFCRVYSSRDNRYHAVYEKNNTTG